MRGQKYKILTPSLISLFLHTFLPNKVESLIGETRSISSSLSAMLHTEAPPVPTCPLTQSNEQNLLNQLYGSHASFTHQLVSNNILDQPLYRERNFK
jgi:hypothetical protein